MADLSTRRSRWTLLVAGLSALVVALVVAAALLLVHNRGITQQAEQRQLALDTARRVATTLTTMNVGNADRQLQSLVQESTGSFREQITVLEAGFQTVLAQHDVASRGSVTAVGIERFTEDTASALVTVAASISNNETPQGERHSFRLAVELQRDGDRWLASRVDYLP